MTRFLHRLGGATAAHPWRTVAAWLLMLAAAVALAATAGGTPQDDWDVPGLPSQAGTDLLRAQFPGAAGAADRVVVHDRTGAALSETAIEALTAELSGMPHVVAVSPPRLSTDRATALLDVRYDVPVTDPDLMGNLQPLQEAIAGTERTGLQVELGGEIPDSASLVAGGTGEVVGVVVALLLLVVTFGSVVAAGLPILVALVGLGVGSAGVLVLAAVTTVSTSAPTVATMVGLGVGIDYALLLVTRHAENLRAGHTVREAAARATATAGRSVVFAGGTVLVSLLGLRLAGLSTYSSFGYATAIAVLSVMAASLTLVPALLGLGKRRVLPRRVRRGGGASGVGASGVGASGGGPARHRAPLAEAWARRVSGRPVPWIVGAAGLLLVLAAPVLDLRMWPSDTGAQPAESTTRQAYDLVAAEFGAGANGPFVVAVDLGEVPAGSLPELRAELAGTAGVAAVSEPVIAPAGTAATLVLEPTTAPSDQRTAELIDRLRAEVLPAGAELTGSTPVLADISSMLEDRIWLVVGFVVAVSLLLLTLVFRAPIVAFKAAVMNLLSIAAAYGVMVATFQWGWGAGLFGLDHAVPISSWVPILMFAVAFGLSMDYEVFLLSRVREDWLRTGDPRGSVVSGLAATGRLISAAAAIMVAVFLGFATEGDLVIKMIGAGLAVAILVDATVVRLVLVPATMALLGRWNWWLPSWLDRLLPHLDIDVHEIDAHDVNPAAGPARPVTPAPDPHRLPVGV